MNNILATTTSVLDLLVILEHPERVRVLSAVRAVLDLVEEPASGVAFNSRGVIGTTVPISPRARAGVGTVVGHASDGSVIVETGPVASPTPKEKPPTAAPKARRANEPGEFRLQFRELIPGLLRETSMALSPAVMRHALLVPDAQKSTFAAALQDLLKEGKVIASGTTASRRYTIA